MNQSLQLMGKAMIFPGHYSERAQVVMVADQAMHPEITYGEFIAVDPDVPARNGDVVIVEDAVGDYHLRRFRQKMGEDFEAYAINDQFFTLNRKEHGAKVAAVMVCHMRLRQP